MNTTTAPPDLIIYTVRLPGRAASLVGDVPGVRSWRENMGGGSRAYYAVTLDHAALMARALIDALVVAQGRTVRHALATELDYLTWRLAGHACHQEGGV